MPKALHGLGAVGVIAGGQALSLIATGMTNFALIIWVWEQSGQATTLAIMSACSFGPMVALTPLAGALVDRWDRKLTMMLSDLGAALATLMILVLVSVDQLSLLALYFLGALAGSFQAFQVPAYGAAVTMMVAKKHYARASSFLEVARFAGMVAAPLLAGLLLGRIGLRNILIIDLISFGLAFGSLALIHVPPPPPSSEDRGSGGSLWTMLGWRYIRDRPGLLGLLLTFCGFNFALILNMVVLFPMILARTGNNEVALGTVQSVLGLGGIAGAVLMGIWGGPRRRIRGVFGGMLFLSLMITMIGLGHGIATWSIAGFFAAATVPLLSGSSQAIWQAKVEPALQGRVFACRRLITQALIPAGFLAGGPIADRILEPALMPGGALAASAGRIVGVGPGSGYAFALVGAGLLAGGVALIGSGVRAIREVEDQLPDHALAAADH